MLSCSIWFSAPSFSMGGGLEICCVGRVYGADGAVHHPHLMQQGDFIDVFLARHVSGTYAHHQEH